MSDLLPRLLATCSVLAMAAAGCVGDLGAESGLPACTARPIDPGGYEAVATERIEGDQRIGYRYAYRGLAGEQVAFYFGVTTDAGAGLPKAGQLPLTTAGGGQLSGQGSEWAFIWNDQFPCDRMRVVGSGLSKKAFVNVLALAQVIPFEEEEGEGGTGLEDAGGGELEEEEGEIEGALPPGGPAVEWVAIFEFARNPDDLERIQRELMRIAPRNVAVSPASCWKGLPQQLGIPRDAYVAGLIAITENELDFLIDRVGRAPTFYGQLRARCD